jgi:16S rRNA (cytosine967-C5)-methyltransferase
LKLASQIQSSIEILEQILNRHRTVPSVMKEWGVNNRYAGVKDRATITNILNASLRKKISSSYIMSDDSPRAILIGTLINEFQFDINTLYDLFNNEKHAPMSLSDEEVLKVKEANEKLKNSEKWIKNDLPEWAASEYEKTFDINQDEQLQHLSNMPDLDIRVNSIKTNISKVEGELQKFLAIKTHHSPYGLRFKATGLSHKYPNLEKTLAYSKGHIEIQNEGSQIASILSGVIPGQQVLDYCAGHGGKAVVLSMLMNNTGQIFLHDIDESRLSNVPSRMRRLGIKNYQIKVNLENVQNSNLFDVVFVDAPCTGSGTWRRKPDLKWRSSKEKLNGNIKAQHDIIREASKFVKVGGKLIYVTCSLFDSENDGQISDFLSSNSAFRLINYQTQWKYDENNIPKNAKSHNEDTLLLSPMTHNTDGFFVAILERLA